jgi:DNA-binding NtrC family response regulator
MHTGGTALPQDAIASLAALDDEELAARSAARLLITADTSREAEALARRLHTASVRAGFPFVRKEASELPVEPHMLRDTCASLVEGAAGGTLFLHDVEAMPRDVQNVFVELLAELESTRAASDAVRVVAATTASLVDRVADGRFSERLFYRLNTIHVTVARHSTIDPA